MRTIAAKIVEYFVTDEIGPSPGPRGVQHVSSSQPASLSWLAWSTPSTSLRVGATVRSA
jgi:hypothetical protein